MGLTFYIQPSILTWGKNTAALKKLICATVSTYELLDDIFWIPEEERSGEKIGVVYICLVTDRASANTYS